MGFNSARDAYMAAVWAAGPLPMMHNLVLRIWRSSMAKVEEMAAAEEDACPGVEVGAAVGAAELEAFRKNLEPLLSEVLCRIDVFSVSV